MIPFFFGVGQRRLFGVYDAANETAGSVPRAVVLCYPWGAEYLHAHRSLRQLASKLSLAGCHTLRFDYFGTGDSSGEMTEADLSGWQDDIETAIEELRDSTGAKSVVLIGLRLGATLAASVAARRRKDVEALVLWDPIVKGETYLEALGLVSGSPVQSADPPTGPMGQQSERIHHIGGFPLTFRMEHELRALDLINSMEALSANTLILVSERLRYYDALQLSVNNLPNKSVSLQHFDDLPAWIERPDNAGVVPVKVLNHIVSWLK
jgi:pimeloyl-ACP methyl ester carboxylesterase